MALTRLNLADEDDLQLSTSNRRFPDGAQFRVEVPTINSLRCAEALFERADELGVTINRITETTGIFRHPARDIERWVELCAGRACELVMSPGPRAVYDTSASVRSTEGARLGYRLRGQEQLVYAIEDLKRGYELGVRTFLAYDEGFMWAVGEMRRNGDLPADIRLKVSAHCGHGNAASLRLLQDLGADSINPVRDLAMPMLVALRRSISVPLDCHTDNPPSSGGFLRIYEASEFVRVLAPVHLKAGNSALASHGQDSTPADARRMAEQAALVVEFVNRHYPSAVQSGVGLVAAGAALAARTA